MSAQLSDPIRMIARQVGDVRVHTFVASFVDDNIADATHIIESENQLVLVDGQFLVYYANEFRTYADRLGKPIERLYLTHRHPDHWFGLGTAFRNVPIYALQETKKFIEQHGEDQREDHVAILKDQAPQQIIDPQKINNVELVPTEIDGVEYVFSKVTDTEIDFHLIIELPALKVAIVQDLIYSGTHLYLSKEIRSNPPKKGTPEYLPYLTKNIDHWIKILSEMLRSKNDLFMPGHGLPADKIEVARNVEYLAAAKSAIYRGLTDDLFKDFMLQRYPGRLCPKIFDIYMPRLFHEKRDY
jgi:glyoxylase-like metal-dependent hydrolase (beta-lactamase superfamily II)